MKAELYILKSRRSQRPECFFVSPVGRTDLHSLQLHLELFACFCIYSSYFARFGKGIK